MHCLLAVAALQDDEEMDKNVVADVNEDKFNIYISSPGSYRSLRYFLYRPGVFAFFVVVVVVTGFVVVIVVAVVQIIVFISIGDCDDLRLSLNAFFYIAYWLQMNSRHNMRVESLYHFPT